MKILDVGDNLISRQKKKCTIIANYRSVFKVQILTRTNRFIIALLFVFLSRPNRLDYNKSGHCVVIAIGTNIIPIIIGS